MTVRSDDNLKLVYSEELEDDIVTAFEEMEVTIPVYRESHKSRIVGQILSIETDTDGNFIDCEVEFFKPLEYITDQHIWNNRVVLKASLLSRKGADHVIGAFISDNPRGGEDE
jgi:hypothetical protein